MWTALLKKQELPGKNKITIESAPEMKKKLSLLSLVCFILSLVIFTWTFYLYHYLTVDFIFDTVWHAAPGKPFITLLFGIWGVTFLFASVMSLLISWIFFPKTKA